MSDEALMIYLLVHTVFVVATILILTKKDIWGEGRMRTIINALIVIMVAFISYRVGHFMGIYDYVQMVERWAKKEEENG